jgi:hypothetical protein
MSNEATGRQFVNINDIEGETDMEGFDPSANAYAPPPPVEVGEYTGTLTFANNNPEERWEKRFYKAEKYPEKAAREEYYFVTRLMGTITTEGTYEGRRVFDDFMSTGIFNNPTSSVASLLKELGYDLDNVRKQTELCQLLEQALAGEPQVKFYVNWEWKGSAEGGYQRIRGQKKIFEAAGKDTHIVEDPDTGEAIPARAIITRYRAV